MHKIYAVKIKNVLWGLFLINLFFFNLKSVDIPVRCPKVYLPRHGPGLRTGDIHKCFAFKLFLASESFLFEWAPNGESVVKIRSEERITSKNKGITLHSVLPVGVFFRRTMCIEAYCVYWMVVHSSKVIQSRWYLFFFSN